jgi:hypothetical protein
MHAYHSSSLKKGVKYFTKKLYKFTKQNDKSLEKSLFSIGKEMNKPRGSGKRKKNWKTYSYASHCKEQKSVRVFLSKMRRKLKHPTT